MGLLLGKVDANVMVVMDSFALPVEGTETRVNAQAQGSVKGGGESEINIIRSPVS